MANHSLPGKTEVLVIGAGPAGSMLAYELARLGIDVLLLDKGKFPRKKTCAGGVNVRAARLLPFDLTPVVENIITGISFTRNLEEPFLRRSTGPLLYVVRRECFDQFLVEKARQAGALFFDGTLFLSLSPKSHAVVVETSSGPCQAQFVIGADGAQSVVAKSLELMQGVPYILAMHSEVPTALVPWPHPDLIHIDWGSLKRSYAYVFPKKETLSLGAGGYNVEPAKIKRYQRSFLATFWQKEEMPPVSIAGFLLPLRPKRCPIQKGRCLLLGDAAGLIDPLIGEGIYYAIRSAQTAAPLLAQALREKWNSLQACEQAIDREIMPELECARMVRGMFNLRPSFFHKKIFSSDRWWRVMEKILRGERNFVDVKRNLGSLGSLIRYLVG